MHRLWSKGFQGKRKTKEDLDRGVEKDCQAHKLNKEEAINRSRWRKLIKDDWWTWWCLFSIKKSDTPLSAVTLWITEWSCIDHTHAYHCLSVLHCLPSHNIQLIFIIANTTAGNVKSITCVNLNVIFLLQSANINTALHLCRLFSICSAFSALTLLVRCQEEHLACTNWLMRCWCGYLSAARCRLFAYGPADATAIPSHHVLPH